MKPFLPFHINATREDLNGNFGIGRYILLPGSDGRAQSIAKNFDNVTKKPHPRGHHLYLGTLNHQGKKLDVATIASGMGCPSMEIILHELYHLGAKRFLRVGTSGSLQPHFVNIGDLINVQAAVRDERTTRDYAPLAVPAIASFEFVSAITQAKENIQLSTNIHTGIVHCKSSLYAREFFAGPRGKANEKYNQTLKQCGVMATEMETAALFMQSQLYNYQLQQQGSGSLHRVLCGAILGVIAVPPDQYATSNDEITTVNHIISLGIETIKVLATTIDRDVIYQTPPKVTMPFREVEI